MDWPQPENSKYVRGLLGHPSYYRNSLNTTLTLPCSFLELANLAKIERILGGILGSWGKSGTLHLPMMNASMLWMPSETHSVMLQSLLHRTPQPSISAMLRLVHMYCVLCFPRCMIRQRMQWVTTAINYTMGRCGTPQMTVYSQVSEIQYCSWNLNNMVPCSHLW
jgi:hypothetical protein